MIHTAGRTPLLLGLLLAAILLGAHLLIDWDTPGAAPNSLTPAIEELAAARARVSPSLQPALSLSPAAAAVPLLPPPPSPSPSTARSLSPSNTLSASAVAPASVSPAGTPSATPLASPSTSPAGTPSVSPASSPSISPAGTPSASPTVSPSAPPTASVSRSPAPSPLPAGMTPRIPSHRKDTDLIAAVCGVCGAQQGAQPQPVCAGATADATSPAPSSSSARLVRMGTVALQRLRTLAMARLMSAAGLASRFPQNNGILAAGRLFSGNFSSSNVTALRFGVLLTPAYLLWDAWDAVVPREDLCAYLAGPLAPAMDATGGSGGGLPSPEVVRAAARAVHSIFTWNWALLLAPERGGGLTLSPEVNWAAVAGLPQATLDQLAAYRSAAPAPPPGEVAPTMEPYSPGTYRWELVQRMVREVWAPRVGGAGSSGGTAPLLASLEELLATAHSLRRLLQAAGSATPVLTVHDDAAFAEGLLKRQERSVHGALEAHNTAEVYASLAPQMLHVDWHTSLLTAFNVVSNNGAEVYCMGDAEGCGRGADGWDDTTPQRDGSLLVTRQLRWGGHYSLAETGPAFIGMAFFGCIMPGRLEMSIPPGERAGPETTDGVGARHAVNAAVSRVTGVQPSSVREVFAATERYAASFYHAVDALAGVMMVPEWVRARAGEAAGGLRLPLLPSPTMEAWLRMLRLPAPEELVLDFHKEQGALRSGVWYGMDTGVCDVRRREVLLSGRDVMRTTLGLPPAGLPRTSTEQEGGGGGAALVGGGRDGVSSTSSAPGPLPRILLLRRRNTRTLSNHEELEAGLRAMPARVSVYDPDSNDTAEMTALAAGEADALVGSHGAGLTHLMLMRTGAVVVELFPHLSAGYFFPLCFLRMSATVFTSHVAFVPPTVATPRDRELTADVPAVVAGLREALRLQRLAAP